MYDIFYLGPKPNLFPHERLVTSLAEAKALSRTRFFWLLDGTVDYSDFDFNWCPPKWEEEQTHVFRYILQRSFFTMFVPTNCDKEILNYRTDQQPMLDTNTMDRVEYQDGDLISAIKSHIFTTPYAIFFTVGSQIPDFEVPIWKGADTAVHKLSKNGSVLVVPKELQGELQTQIYDFRHIITHNELFFSEKSLDIVYISNGEPDAERWYDHLVTCAPGKNILRVKDVKGRSAAYKAAANISTTPWFFAVFAKLEVNPEFDWNWQPDYFQEPKHYIFYAYNPVNDLTYGHMAVLAYNKKLVLETDDHGLDFTLSKKHEVVESLSATAHFNQDELMTWRTAFRECIKLRAANDEESRNRLAIWSTVAHGPYAEWSLRGAREAIKYYETVGGGQEDLMRSFEWEWVNKHFDELYHL